VKPVYKTPWQDPLQEMTSRQQELTTRRAALLMHCDAAAASASAAALELLEVEEETLQWQMRRLAMTESTEGATREKVKFNKEYSARMAELRCALSFGWGIRSDVLSGAASRQLVVSHRWGNPAGRVDPHARQPSTPPGGSRACTQRAEL